MNSNANQLRWEDIKYYVPMLFLHDHQAAPPPMAERLWSCLEKEGLTEFDSDIEKSKVWLRLLTLAMIQQEFRLFVFRSGTTVQPLDVLQFLEIPIEHVALINRANDTPPTGNLVTDLLALDSANREALAAALDRQLGSADAIFKTLAFPNGLEAARQSLPIAELVAQPPSPDEAPEEAPEEASEETMAQLVGEPNVEAGLKFIQGGFESTMTYGE